MKDSDYLGHLWALTPHVCSRCYARVLAREDGGEPLVYRCSNCGLEATGADESVICTCGLPGAQCQENRDPTPDYPGQIVAVALGSAP